MRKLSAMPILILLIAAAGVFGQQRDPAGQDFVDRGGDGPNRARILRRALGLTPRQMVMIRNINLEIRPRMRAAQETFRSAKRELDAAIYADQLDEEQVRLKVRAVIEAEAEVTKLRAMSEVAVRKVLTPEQLVKFRELRQRFARQGERLRGGGEHRRDKPGPRAQRPADDQPPQYRR